MRALRQNLHNKKFLVVIVIPAIVVHKKGPVFDLVGNSYTFQPTGPKSSRRARLGGGRVGGNLSNSTRECYGIICLYFLYNCGNYVSFVLVTQKDHAT